MLKRAFIVLGIVLVVIACSSGPKKPKNLISKKVMVSILIDAKLISSANSVNKKVMEENGVFPNSYIYNKYNIDSLQFAESNEYYTFKVKDYEEIYEMVKDSLDRLKVYYKELHDKEKKAVEKKSRDSLDTVLKKRDSLKLIDKDSLGIITPKDALEIKELEGFDINEEEINLIDSVSDK